MSTTGPLGKYDMIGENAIPQGATWPVSLTYINPTDVVFDFTGYTAKMQVRQTYNTPVLLELSTENGGITLGSTSPNVVLNFSPEFTSPMTHYREMIYDIECYGPSNTVVKFLKGKFEIDREITLP